ncbi:hypothetical protein FH972_007132 [Carpinus fangiana]|uniref:Uncharacterized protein n=1 Tax=Carpinus fangiana TaxID=176857 RepID=A0A5N6QXZ6_9ROSI|nr:hypothetical protein FH972_007132 [Carpinus fangiana]
MSYGELTCVVNALKRFEDCKVRLSMFANRKRNDGLWELIGETKMKLLMMIGKMEEMRLVMVRMGRRDDGGTHKQTFSPSPICRTHPSSLSSIFSAAYYLVCLTPRCSELPAMPCRLARVFSNGVNYILSAWLQRLAGGFDDVKPAGDVVVGGDLRRLDLDSANAFNSAGI